MTIGRVTEVHRTNFIVWTEDREVKATVRGNFHSDGDFPKVGDYVELKLLEDNKAVIESIKDRSSIIKRKSADSDEEQVLVTNVDKILIVMGLDGDFNISRLERYLLLAKQSGIKAVVVLNKSDLCDDVTEYKKVVENVSGDSPVLIVSALTEAGLDELWLELEPGTTSVLLGSSGAGKSTITNYLLNDERQKIKETREGDNRGRHTTTTRQLFSLPNGSYLIDTPGMRELGLLDTDADDENIVFDKISELSKLCKFRNCDHEKSEGCAILAAVQSGELEQRELDNYSKLIRERSFQESKDSDGASRYYAQNQKRQNQKNKAIQKQKLLRRLQ